MKSEDMTPEDFRGLGKINKRGLGVFQVVLHPN